ncbi:MAG: mechanosensitive ion channel domain-containing protein [Burkholderiales bacterium]
MTGKTSPLGQGAPVVAEAPPEKDSVAALRPRLAETQAELERINASPNQALDAPPDAPPGQIVFRQVLLRQLIRAYQGQIDDVSALEKLRARRTPVEQRLARWRMDPSRVPFSMLEVEALRREVQLYLRRIESLTARLEANEGQSELMRNLAARADQGARQLLERIEKREGAVPLLIWERDLQLLRSRVAVATIDAQASQRELRQEELSGVRAELAFLESQLNLTAGKVDFSEKDREALTAQLDARLKVLEDELVAGLAAAEKARREGADAQARLAAARALPEGKGGERIPALERAAELAQMRFDTAQTRTNVVRLMIESVEPQRALWGTWYDIVRTKNADIARQLGAAMDGYRTIIGKLDASARAALRFTLSQAIEFERAAIVAPNAADAAYLRSKVATLHERAQWQARLSADTLSVQDLLDRWRVNFIVEAGQTSNNLTLDEWWYRAKGFARAVWTFELFTAQDTIEVEGRKLTAERSITLGKVVTAILILVIGLWLGRLLINGTGRFAVRYLRADANGTQLVGKWLFALLFVILFVLSLTTVKIPFTVFAFLGGAVAIGVGFGMQTLLKNLISGLMLLVERPFRLGDIVEVGAIRGKVTDINVRSSLIRNRDGIETLIPNSTFLEQNVTNWTYSSSRVRYTLNVGIAYGSPTDAVRDLLLATAQRHGLVLPNPEPEVFFDDFGADALLFSLQIWLDIAGSVDSRRVASDLRFMIDKAFAEAGIAIAFPQRDVHLNAAQPIPVRVVSPDPPPDGNGQP